MGRSQRDKGAKWERAVANYLRPWFPKAERRGVGFEASDLVGIPYSVECKNQQRWDVPGWWRQTLNQAETDDLPPLLIIKNTGKADPGEALAVMRLADLAPLLEESDQ